MKSKQTVIIIGQLIIIGILVVFGLTQRTKNEVLSEALIEANMLAEQHRIEAINQHSLAERNAEEARRQAAEAQRQMQLCLESQKKK